MNLDRIVGAAQGAAEEVARRAQRGLVLGGVLAALLVVAFGFATAALYLALAAELAPLHACLAIAGGYLVAAIIVLLIARSGGGERRASPPRRPPADRPGAETDAVSQLIATFLAGVRAGREGFGRRDR